MGKVQRVRLVSVESEWSVVTLKEHFEALLVKLDKRIAADIQHAKDVAKAAQDGAHLATQKSEAAINDRFAGHNEFNRRIDSIISNTTSRAEFTQLKDQYASDALGLSSRLGSFVGVARYDELRASVEKLTERLNTIAGEKAGKQDTVDNSRANMAIAVSIFTALVVALPAAFNLIRPLAPSAAAAAPPPQVIYMPAPNGTMLPSPPQTVPQR